MTICIAALCDNGNNILGMSDTRITSWNSSFDSGEKTSIIFGTGAVVMIAGDLDFQNTILAKLQNVVRNTKNNEWRLIIDGKTGKARAEGIESWTIEKIKDLYIDVYNEIKRQRVENSILKPLGLNLETFMNGENGTENFQKWIADKVSSFAMPEIETIIAGTDSMGRHIFIVENLTDSQAVSICCNRQGFACIGNGAKQADSEFILAKYTPKMPFEDAILLAYIAKKRAELARDVGAKTTFFFVYDDETEIFQSGFFRQKGGIEQMLEKSYKTLKEKEKKAREQVTKGFKSYVRKFIENAKKEDRGNFSKNEGQKSIK